MLLVFCSFSVVAQTGPADDGIVKQLLFIDSDRDGVDDAIDECYRTPANTKVNAKGCFLLIKDSRISVASATLSYYAAKRIAS